MPVDQKRLNGPDSSVSYHLHSPEQLLDYESRLKLLFKEDDDSFRKDGRKLDELRKICTVTRIYA